MSFFEELKRRNVFRVGIAYLIVAWLLLQVTDIVAPILELPDVFSKGVLFVLAIGLPIAGIFAWAFEMTPEGVKKEKDVDRSQSITPATGRKLDFVIIGVLSVAVAIFALDKFVWTGGTSIETQIAETIELDKSIAVLPFANRSADESDAYFVDGIHDDILTQLHKVSGIDKVISRTSMERYRDTDMPIPEIAAELGVATILEGSVQRAGDRVRITVQLIGAANDEHMWAENFDRELTTANVFEIQSEISRAIATSLQAALTVDEANDLSGLPTQNLAAYDAYLLGKHTIRSRVFSEYPRGRAYFERAISLDPGFALAHVGLADTINLMTIFGRGRSTVEERAATLDDAVSTAMRALDINDRLGEAYAALGYSYWQYGELGGRGIESLQQADDYYKTAIELSPNYADLYRWYAQLLWMGVIGRPVEAVSMAERAVELDPMFAVNHWILSMAYGINGRLNDGLKSIERSLEISPAFLPVKSALILLLDARGEYAQIVVTETARRGEPTFDAANRARIGFAYRALGAAEQSESYVSLSSDRGGAGRLASMFRAMVALDGGDTEAAMTQFKDMLATSSDCSICVNVITRIYARNAQPEALLDFVREHRPRLLNRESMSLTSQSLNIVAPAVWALNETGEREHASELIERGLEVARSSPRRAIAGHGMEVADVEMHAVMGNHRFALDALTQAVDEGYRNLKEIDDSHFLDPLRSEPDYIAATDIIRADLDVQLEQLKEMERNGELPALPR